MLPLNSRQAKILKIVQAQESVSVTELVDLLSVSPATIRKDLVLLQGMNLVQRTHGEAHMLPNSSIVPIEHRSAQDIEAKKAIARVAFSLINEGDSIILDAGSTALELAKMLVEVRGLTIVTNSLPVATVLANSKSSILMPGGMLLGETLSTQGPDTDRYLGGLDVDIAFIAASGVRANVGLTSQNPLEHSVKQAMMKAARHVCAVVDSSKFAKSGVHLFGRFEEFDTIITETGVPEATLSRLAEEGTVRWLVADRL